MNRIQEIETRLSEIRTELEAPDANLDALQEEVRSCRLSGISCVLRPHAGRSCAEPWPTEAAP